MSSAIVFGSRGQMGAAVAEHLLASGWRVSAVTHDGRRPPATVVDGGAELIDGSDRTRAEILQDLGHPVDAVFDPTSYTVEDAEDLISARGRFGSLVVLSSASVYADPEGRSLDEAAETGFPRFGRPIDEDTATVEPGPLTYSTRKVALERALLSSGIGATILRPCAVYGKQATHLREWWFIKRALDGRSAIPVAFGANSVFQTSSARGIATIAGLCMNAPGQRILNVADNDSLSVREIALVIEDATGLALPLRPFDGPPFGESHVGSTPWSAEHPYILDTSAARSLGWDGGTYGHWVPDVCRWALDVSRSDDWRAQFTRFARYGYDPFDYQAEDSGGQG